MKTEKNVKHKKKDAIPLTIIKLIGGVTISIGVGAILKNVFKQYTPEQTNKLIKVCTAVGSFFLSSSVATMVVDRFEADVDNIWTAVNKVLENTEEEIEPFEAVLDSEESLVIE